MSSDGILIEKNIRERRFDVDSNFDGWRLARFLANRIGGLSDTKAAKVADEGDVEIVPGRDVGAATELFDGDEVIVREHLPPERVQDDQVEFLYSDGAVLVLSKPAGMLVHETARVRLNTITHYLQRKGLGEVEPVHRIDAETSGVLVCARQPEFVSELRRQFSTADPEKTYRALVVDPDRRWRAGDTETIEIPLGFDEESSLPHRMGRGELEAITHVEVVDRRPHPMGELADVCVRIETGRQHQIRVHLALQNTPIAGDKMYGKTDEFFKAICDHPNDEELLDALHFPRHALHARRIELDHPFDDRRISVEAPLPDWW